MDSHRVILIDNYDSYVYNLFQAIGELTSQAAMVFRNDETNLAHLQTLRPTHIILSPGPGTPENPNYFGIGKELLLTLGKTIPILGVCLGHQGIAHAFGGKVVRAQHVMHGKTSSIFHEGTGIFEGLPTPFTAMRYHSLVVEEKSLPASLRVTARTDDGVIMGLAHETFPIWGVQFHPESIGTPEGLRLLKNFLG